MSTRTVPTAPSDFDGFDDIGDRERSGPRQRRTIPGHPSAWARAPRIEPIVARRPEPGVASRILAEAALIDDAYRRNPPHWGELDAVVLDILMNRR